jgi:TolB-like protein/DNA-binding winged helix-turn-helix (wHTH) protein
VVDERARGFWQIGDWQVAPDLGEIFRDGQTKKLDPRAMRLLMYLAERPGQVVGVSELLDGVWGKAVVTPHSVYEGIAALRQALGDASAKPVYVATLPRRGYRLIARVEQGARPEQGAAAAMQSSPVGHPSATGQATTAAQTRSISPLESVRYAFGRLSRRSVIVGLLGVAILASATTIWFEPSERATVPPVPDDKSIAVLPFLDLSEKKDQEYFADGLAEELLEVLVNVPGLRVIGRTSSFQFKDKNEDVRSIGAKLNAEYIVEGSVRRDGQQIRVAAQLIRASDGVHQWSGTYDRRVEDTLPLESELAMALGRALQLSVDSNSDLTRLKTGSSEANERYLRGLHALDGHTRSGADEAVNQFQAALALDPHFAGAAVALGNAHYVQAAFGFVPPRTGFPQVRQDALNALKLDDRMATAHALLARVATLFSWDWDEAQRESERALALEPRNWFALFAAGDLASVLGDSERAERLFRAALVSDPLNPEVHFMLALVLPGRGQSEEGETEARRCLAIAPAYAGGHFLLAGFLMGKNEAVVECTRETSEGGQLPCLAEAYFALGRLKEADASLQQATEIHGFDQAYLIAAAFASRGDADHAFEWLQRAYSQRDPILQYIKTDPEFDHLKDDQRYKTLLRQMNLSE